jgi:hypothetical protein
MRLLLYCASITSSVLPLLPFTWAAPSILEAMVNFPFRMLEYHFQIDNACRHISSPGASLASTCGSDVMLLSLVDPAAPFVPVSCNDDTITAICFAPRCLEVMHQYASIMNILLRFDLFLLNDTQVVIASRSSFVRICATVDGSELRKFRVVGGVVQVRAHFLMNLFIANFGVLSVFLQPTGCCVVTLPPGACY